MTNHPPDSTARTAGALLLLTAVATVLSVVARLSADADQPTLAESLAAIADSRWFYGIGGAARFVSGVTLLAAAWFLLRTWIIRERLATPLVPALLGVSGVITGVSGVCAVVLVAAAPEAPGANIAASTETFDYLRWVTGKIGFTAAGVGLIGAALYQWKAGGGLRYISPASAVIGVAMLFIWVDAATVVHPISGAAFFVWLMVIGAMLATGPSRTAFCRNVSLSSFQVAH